MRIKCIWHKFICETDAEECKDDTRFHCGEEMFDGKNCNKCSFAVQFTHIVDGDYMGEYDEEQNTLTFNGMELNFDHVDYLAIDGRTRVVDGVII